jgi:hypothetical protein
VTRSRGARPQRDRGRRAAEKDAELVGSSTTSAPSSTGWSTRDDITRLLAETRAERPTSRRPRSRNARPDRPGARLLPRGPRDRRQHQVDLAHTSPTSASPSRASRPSGTREGRPRLDNPTGATSSSPASAGRRRRAARVRRRARPAVHRPRRARPAVRRLAAPRATGPDATRRPAARRRPPGPPTAATRRLRRLGPRVAYGASTASSPQHPRTGGSPMTRAPTAPDPLPAACSSSRCSSRPAAGARQRLLRGRGRAHPLLQPLPRLARPGARRRRRPHQGPRSNRGRRPSRSSMIIDGGRRPARRRLARSWSPSRCSASATSSSPPTPTGRARSGAGHPRRAHLGPLRVRRGARQPQRVRRRPRRRGRPLRDNLAEVLDGQGEQLGRTIDRATRPSGC